MTGSAWSARWRGDDGAIARLAIRGVPATAAMDLLAAGSIGYLEPVGGFSRSARLIRTLETS